MLHELIRFEPTQLGDAHRVWIAGPREVVPQQVDDHDVLRAVFFAFEQIDASEQVGFGPERTPTGSLDRPGFDLALVDAQEPLGRGAKDLQVARVEVGGEGRRIALPQAEIEG